MAKDKSQQAEVTVDEEPFVEEDVEQSERERREAELYKNKPGNLRLRAFDRMLVQHYIDEGWIREEERYGFLEDLTSEPEKDNWLERGLNRLIANRVGLLGAPCLIKLSKWLSNKIDVAQNEDQMIEQARLSMISSITERFKK